MPETSLPESDFIKRVEIGISIQTAMLALLLQIGLNYSDQYSCRLLGLEAHQDLFALRCLLLCLISLLALSAGFRIPRHMQVLTFLQLFAIAVIAQTIFYSSLGAAPLSTLTIVCFALATGNFLKLLRERELRYQAQFYANTLKSLEVDETKLSLVKQEEAERRILACDLHDQVLNDIKEIKGKVAKLEHGKTDDIKTIEKLLDDTAAQIRSVMESLCPSVLENLGLQSALDELLRDAARRGDFKARLDASLFSTELGKIEELLIFRIAQEVLNNVIKHATARSVTIKLSSENETLSLSIADNGKGLDPETERGQSRGLRYIRQRADLLGAKASWKNENGVTFELTMPLRKS